MVDFLKTTKTVPVYIETTQSRICVGEARINVMVDEQGKHQYDEVLLSVRNADLIRQLQDGTVRDPSIGEELRTSSGPIGVYKSQAATPEKTEEGWESPIPMDNSERWDRGHD